MSFPRFYHIIIIVIIPYRLVGMALHTVTFMLGLPRVPPLQKGVVLGLAGWARPTRG